MAIGATVTHPFVCAIADDPAATAAGEVTPSRYNLPHTVTFTGFGTGVETALANNAGAAGGFALFSATPAGANPTATIGTSAVNGSASTFMRSDAAPAFGNLTGDVTSVGMATTLATTQPGAHTWPQDQTFGARIIAKAGSRASPSLVFTGDTTTGLWLDASNTFRFTIAGATDIFSITSGVGVETIASGVYRFSGRSAISSVANSSITVANNAGTSSFQLTAPSTNTVQIGPTDAASPVAQTLQAQGSRAGTDSNVGGANLTVTAGNGTGTGTISSLILQSPVAVASGTGAQTQTTGLTIKGGQAVLPSYTVATLPTGIKGGMAQVTDGDASLAWGATVINSGAGATYYQVNYNGSNWTVVGK